MFPAYAGMIREFVAVQRHIISVPRIRGDDPADGTNVIVSYMCSPHTRG